MLSREDKIEALRDMLARDGWREVVKPHLEAEVARLEQSWLNGTRRKGEEALTDEGIKQRVWTMAWILGWDRRLESLVNIQTQEDEMRAKTEFIP